MSLNAKLSQEIRQKVHSVVCEVSGMELSELKADLSIEEDIAPTSLDRVTLFMALEDEFSSSIPEEEVQGIKTLGDLIHFVESRLDAATA